MKPKKFVIGGLVVLGLIVLAALFFYFVDTDKSKSIEAGIDNFEVDTFLLKVSVNQGLQGKNEIKITNSDIRNDFLLRLEGFDGLASLSEEDFTLSPGEIKKIAIYFNTPKNYEGVYVGNLIINSGGEEKLIPIVLEAQSSEVIFDSDVNLFPRGRDIILGEQITANINIFDLVNIGRRNVKLNYIIKDFNQGILISDSENLIIDGRLDHSKTILIPEHVNVGDYLLIIEIKYAESFGASSVFFTISEKRLSKEGDSESVIFFIIILIVLLLFVFSVLFIYSIFSRDKILKDLQGQYRREIKLQREIVDIKEKDYSLKLKKKSEKKLYKKEAIKVRKKRMNYIKDEYKKRVIEYKKIKSGGSKSLLKSKLRDWKSRGYNTKILERKFKIPNSNNIKRKIREWKKKGYDTKLLDEQSG